jgi:hypothetical protein
MEESIFVQVASYRDPQLIPTLHSLIRQASRPERLRVVVCWQHGLDEMIGSPCIGLCWRRRRLN